MNSNKIDDLIKIYNTLLLINTRGEDTIVMADCLKALHQFISEERKEITTQIEEE